MLHVRSRLGVSDALPSWDFLGVGCAALSSGTSRRPLTMCRLLQRHKWVRFEAAAEETYWCRRCGHQYEAKGDKFLTRRGRSTPPCEANWFAARLKDDIAKLRGLIDSFLDEGRTVDDLLMVSATHVLRFRLDELGREASETERFRRVSTVVDDAQCPPPRNDPTAAARSPPQTVRPW